MEFVCVDTQWFGYYKPGETSAMYTLQDSPLYTEVEAGLLLRLLYFAHHVLHFAVGQLYVHAGSLVISHLSSLCMHMQICS